MNREKLRLLLAIILLALPFVSTHAEETTDYDYVLVTDVSQLQEGQEYALLSAEEGNPRYISQFSSNNYLECSGVRIDNFNSERFNSRQRTGLNKPLYHIGIELNEDNHYIIKNGAPDSQNLFWTYDSGSLSSEPLPSSPSDNQKKMVSWDISFDSDTHKANIVSVHRSENHWVFVSQNGSYIINNSTKATNLSTDIGLRLYRKVNPDNPPQGEEKTASPVPTPAAGTQDNSTALYAPEALTFSTTSGTVSYSLDGTSWAEVGTDGISLYDLADKQAKTVKLQFKAKEEGKTESDVIEGWYTFKYRSATTFAFNNPPSSLQAGESAQLRLNTSYDAPNSETPTITYISSKESVATISADGKTVTALAPGETTIKAAIIVSDTENTGWISKETSFTLTVTAKPQTAVPLVNLNGGTTQSDAEAIYAPAKITVTPAEGSTVKYSTDGGTTWADYKDNVSFYKDDKSENPVHLQFKAVANGKKDSEIVDGWYTFKYRSATLTFAEQTLSLEQGKTSSVELTATFDAPNNETQPISYISNDDTVATVDTDGKVTAVKPGTATIKAFIVADDNWISKEATFEVTVTAPAVPLPKVIPEGGLSQDKPVIIYSPDKITVSVTEGRALYRDIYPGHDATDWKELPQGGIFIDNNDNTPITANIKCITLSNQNIQSKEVSGWYTFKYKTATLGFAETNVSGNAGTTIENNNAIVSIVEAPTGDTPTITYTSSNTEVATVDSSGKVTLLKSGTANITASINEENGWKPATAYYTVTVRKKQLSETDFCFNPNTVSVKFGDTITHSTLTKPDDADGTITYTSDDPTNFQINQTNGNIEHVLKAGTYTITAKLTGDSKYEEATATYTITVTKADASLSLTYGGNPLTDVETVSEIGVLQADPTNLKPYTLTVSPGYDFKQITTFDETSLAIANRVEDGDEHQRTNTFYLKALKAGESTFAIKTPATDNRNETSLQFTVQMEKLNVALDFSKWNDKTLDLRTAATGPENNRKLTLDFTKTLTAGVLSTDGIDIWNYIEATTDMKGLNVLYEGDKIILSNLQPGEVNISIKAKDNYARYLNVTGGSFKIILAEAVAKPSFSKTESEEAISGGTEQKPTVIYLNKRRRHHRKIPFHNGS